MCSRHAEGSLCIFDFCDRPPSDLQGFWPRPHIPVLPVSQPFTPYILFKIPPPLSFHRMIALAFCTLSAKFSAYLRLCVCLLALLEGNHLPTPNWEQSLNNTDSVPFTSGDLKSGCV